MKKPILLSFLALGVSLTAAAQTKGQDETTDVNQYGQVVSSKPVNAALQDGILVFQNKTENYKMWFDVRIQGDAAVYFGQDENLVKIGNGMSLRRTRFAIKAQLDENWYGELDTDWTSGAPELKDAILAYTGLPHFEIKAGNFKENFSLQRNTTSRYLQFMERPMVTSLAPSSESTSPMTGLSSGHLQVSSVLNSRAQRSRPQWKTATRTSASARVFPTPEKSSSDRSTR